MEVVMLACRIARSEAALEDCAISECWICVISFCWVCEGRAWQADRRHKSVVNMAAAAKAFHEEV
jgi:hypothetical protein